MKIKQVLMCGVLAAAAMLTGCKEKSANSDSNSVTSTPLGAADSGASNNSETTSSGSASGKYTMDSVKPKEINGFEGNLTDVSPKSGDLIATFEIEGYGTIKAVLFPEAAPVGVENFQKLCDSGFYKGLKIHRVVEDFMFQGGSTNGDGTGGDAMVNNGLFSIETTQNARHFYGALCYANAGSEFNSTQFYIVNNKEPQDIDAMNPDEGQRMVDTDMEFINENYGQYDQDMIDYFLSQVKYNQNMVDFMKYASSEIKDKYKQAGGTPTLDGNYTVFGQVYEGFDVIDTLSACEVADNGSGEISKPVKDIIIKDVTVSTFE